MNPINMLLEYMRRKVFWTIDTIKGSKIKQHYKQIKLVVEKHDASEDIRKTNLTRILNHAVTTTAFYKDKTDFNSIEDFKVIDKNVIRNHYNAFQSTEFQNKPYKTMFTSGSTGIPLEVKHDKNKVLRNTADSIYFSQGAGFQIGYKLLYLRNWDDHLKKSKILKFIQNIEELEVVDLKSDYMEKILNRIKKDTSTKGWLGYPSGFELVCKYMDKTNAKPIHSNIKSIITMSEGLNSYTKQAMTKYFNAPTVSRYSNTENGIIAQQTANSNDYVINWASYYVEIFKFDEDRPANSGELGRILVTDLFNYANPMIRYDTGDIGAFNHNVNPPTFKVIEGRKSDIIYTTQGDVMSSIIISFATEYKGVFQAQLIQESQKKYKIILNATKAFSEEKKLILQFKGFLGEDAKINIEYVHEIPVLSSGKRKATINNYIK